LGKVQNVSAAALMPDGSPLLIIDVDDLIRNIEYIVSGQR
jgi:two-component system sensor histidine kinase and response regulator WspE